MISTDSRGSPVHDRRIPVIAAFIPLVLLAFSDEFLDAVIDALGLRGRRPLSMPIDRLIVPIDAAIILVILVLKRRIRKRLQAPRRRKILLWWGLGALLTVGLDLLATTNPSMSKILWFDLLASFLYVLALAILVATTIDASPSLLLSRRLRHARPDEWIRVRAAIPLLVGTMGAYFASVWWEFWLRPINHGVNKEFFAQVSQVIALLIVAIGIEVGFFRQAMSDTTQRAMAILSVLILCLGEALALSALTSEDRLYPWHVYLAFIITVEACLIALATLVWVLVVRATPHSDFQQAPSPVPPRASGSDPIEQLAVPADRKNALVATVIVTTIAGLVAVSKIRRSNR